VIYPINHGLISTSLVLFLGSRGFRRRTRFIANGTLFHIFVCVKNFLTWPTSGLRFCPTIYYKHYWFLENSFPFVLVLSEIQRVFCRCGLPHRSRLRLPPYEDGCNISIAWVSNLLCNDWDWPDAAANRSGVTGQNWTGALKCIRTRTTALWRRTSTSLKMCVFPDSQYFRPINRRNFSTKYRVVFQFSRNWEFFCFPQNTKETLRQRSKMIVFSRRFRTTVPAICLVQVKSVLRKDFPFVWKLRTTCGWMGRLSHSRMDTW